MSNVLKVYRMAADVKNLHKATTHSACYDIHAYFGTNSRVITCYDSFGGNYAKVATKSTDESSFEISVDPMERVLIPTGIILDIPVGYSVRIHPRSGKSIKEGCTLINCEGVIDSDYNLEIGIPIINLSDKEFSIKHGDRIAQLELIKNEEYDIAYISNRPENKSERIGGFGSTGK
jgi:dUTP pyrophosphatase